MKLWQEKAHRLIYNLSSASYIEYNFTVSPVEGKPMVKRYKRHHPYPVPQLACDLIECLNKDDEETAKAIFLSYDGLRATY